MMQMYTVGAFPQAVAASPNQAVPAAGKPAEEAREPQDKSFIRRGLEGMGGLVGGAVSSVYHLPIGVVKGMSEGLAEYKNERGHGWYNFLFIGQGVGIGAGIGLMYGGPVGAAIGAGAGLVASGLARAGISFAGADDRWVDRVEKAVDRAVEDNTEGSKIKLAVQNATEGAIVGAGTGFKEGWNIGREAGKGVVGGVLDVTGGVLEGIKEVIFGA